MDAIQELGFQEPSPIQAEAIPYILSGADIIGHSRTGTGKTAAFAIPTLEAIDSDSDELQALVLCPTRELVVQVAEEFRKLGKYKENLSILPIYGGEDIVKQLKALKKNPKIVVGTPGRIMDHMRRKTLVLSSVQIVILDEADEMLDMGFREDMETILGSTPLDRQTILFSATLSQRILALTKKFQHSPKTVDVTNLKTNAPKIQQFYFEVPESARPEAIVRLLSMYSPKLSLVFCNTKSQVDSLAEILKSRGIHSDGLHGDLSQKQRDRVMSGFRNGSISVLVATDVAGRGIDVNDVEAVFNYDLPRDTDDYVHRIGRTGRAGRKGMAFSFIWGRQARVVYKIEDEHSLKMERGTIPSVKHLEKMKLEEYGHLAEEVAKEGDLTEYSLLVKKITSEGIPSENLAAALLKLVMSSRTEAFDESISFDQEKRKSNFQEDHGKKKDRDNGKVDSKNKSKGKFGNSNRPGKRPGPKNTKSNWKKKNKSKKF
nr:DEAD/DEAH box helicase [Leptospira perolatii]